MAALKWTFLQNIAMKAVSRDLMERAIIFLMKSISVNKKIYWEDLKREKLRERDHREVNRDKEPKAIIPMSVMKESGTFERVKLADRHRSDSRNQSDSRNRSDSFVNVCCSACP